jgi:anti-sigma B factor antagonist
MTDLIITERQNNFITILDLQGKIRLGGGSAELHEALRRLAERGEKKVLLNLAGVSHIDSSGLGELVSGYTVIHKAGGELKLFHLSERIEELMEMTKLLTIFDVYDNEPEALRSFSDTSAKSVYADSLI